MTQLSNRQYPMLEVFVQQPPRFRMSLEDAHGYDQRPFGSMLHRGWIVYKRGQGFAITKEGREAWRIFHETDISRKSVSHPLSHYFDPVAYGLRDERASRPREHKALERGAA